MMDHTLLRATLAHRILLGLVLVSAALTKLVLIGVDELTTVFLTLGLPFASFFAWVVPLAELVSGAGVLCNYKLKHTAWPGILTTLGVALTLYWYGPGSINGSPNWTQVFLHLTLASNLFLLSLSAKR
jgi:uncharacterized membrane protein YphA (DoxX/SURF4 family)